MNHLMRHEMQQSCNACTPRQTIIVLVQAFKEPYAPTTVYTDISKQPHSNPISTITLRRTI